MIIYQSNKKQFCEDVLTNRIEEIILAKYIEKTGGRVGRAELNSWKNSMGFMGRIVSDNGIPDDSGIAIEFRIPSSMQRIDFIITGSDETNREHAILIELKQWENIELTESDGQVITHFQHGDRLTNHPSYQVWSYSTLIEDFNETVQKEKISLIPCAYLHNYDNAKGKIDDSFYNNYINLAPLFLKGDAIKLREFIKKFIKKGDTKNLLFRIDNGKIKPSKSLTDSLDSMLKGNREFVMIDDQKVVYEKALHLIKIAEKGTDQVLIVEGGPGTGKSVVAINLLVELLNRQYTAHYITKNSAPRSVFEAKLSGSMSKSRISSLFQGSGGYVDVNTNLVDVLIVDEAHRLNEKSNYFGKGDNQIKEIINASKLSIFFIDEDQRIHFKDIGEIKSIAKYAEDLHCEVTYMQLSSQFRCNGSDGYLAWLDGILQIKETANYTLDSKEYEFRVFDNPDELRDLIYQKNEVANKARMVAGYCWDWRSKNNKNEYDISFPNYGFNHRWNLESYGSNWIIHPESVSEIGCIHTCQGLEVDYIGVIIGKDLIVRNGEVITQPKERSKNDSSIKGYLKLLEENPIEANSKAEMIIKNTYRTLMTRGMKGCYIYSEDDETRDYFTKYLT